MKRKFKCPACGYEWVWNWFKWVWKAPFHGFKKRLTACPKCGVTFWAKGEKQ